VPIRVLLVDDVPDVRRLVRTALRFRGGFDVVGEAADGTAAIRLAEATRPDVVVLDLGLPDLAGREVLSKVRQESPASRIVVFSGLDSEHDPSIAEVVEGYVYKDAELDHLIDILERVGREPEHSATLDLGQSLASAGVARGFIRDLFRSWQLSELVDDALIVVSELTTNAVTHAYSGCQLRVTVRGDRIRIEAVDGGVGTPDPQPRSSTSEHGRGLHLVAALSTAWGIDLMPEGRGKVVWAELVNQPSRNESASANL
jgi:CheY-like chemotaxis protein